MKHDTARNLIHSCESLENTTDRKNAGVVLDFVSNVNESLFLEVLKEDERMTEAMKILIEPELMNLRLIINNKDAEIADKDTGIAKLKQQLLEANLQPKEF